MSGVFGFIITHPFISLSIWVLGSLIFSGLGRFFQGCSDHDKKVFKEYDDAVTEWIKSQSEESYNDNRVKQRERILQS